MNTSMRTDPRSVGDLVYCGYWRTHSVILRIEVKNGTTWVTELNLTLPNEKLETGTPNVKTHCTAWDWRRDKFCSFNVLEELAEGGFASYEEFLYIMRDCVDYCPPVSYPHQP